MSTPIQGGQRWRNSHMSRNSMSPSPVPLADAGRPKSMILSSPISSPYGGGGSGGTGPGTLQRFQSASPGLGSLSRPTRRRSNSTRSSMSYTGTFAPRFINGDQKTHDGAEYVSGLEGENDFSGKRYVWIPDATNAFIKGWVVQEIDNDMLMVQCDDGSQREVEADGVDKVNPAKFDKANDMAELTHLNEPSVVHNLYMRYQADLIYTYSGLFLVTVNPYCPLPIYSKEYVNLYRGRGRDSTSPHIFAMADEAFRNLVEEGANQSILVTGESGAGKTENTKKVIQYLAAVATTDNPRAKSGRQNSDLSEQILRANPILESFGNAQTLRNNNSSRFGKFIRIGFTRSGQISGAHIDWYLLEKSRVVRLSSKERNYHIFYQVLHGADSRTKNELLLNGMGMEDFEYTREGNDMIAGFSDKDEWASLIESFRVMAFSDADQRAILRTLASVLHLGNIPVTKESLRGDQAALGANANTHVSKVCQLLGIAVEPFVQALLHPKVKAGREWVEKVQTPEQVKYAINALAMGIYERGFGDLVNRINRQLDRSAATSDDSHFIGVLDIAGFEIFEENSFEQLCINYTNEKLQQFFNHHMFVLEQEEYAREQIEWKFIDFGRELQPTIDLIELPNPVGIFSCLDEDCVMPKATDKTFTEKLHSLWDKKTPKYKPSLLKQGFMLTHYAAEVEYSTTGWLEKNKDPLNDNITRLLAGSKDPHIANLFSDCADAEDDVMENRVKRGLFRTVAQRHKEQLFTLMNQLHSTHPHFVRCILPNHRKKAKQFSAPLVLDQLRCNGVLEGIRIARTGFPNRLFFAEFRERYGVLCPKMPRGFADGQAAVKVMLEKLNMDRSYYRVGLTKVFFRAGVLAELEEQRDALISDIVTRFQSTSRAYIQRRAARKKLYRAEAARIIQQSFRTYIDLQANPWWNLFTRMKPLLGETRPAVEVKKRDEVIHRLEQRMQQEAMVKQRLDEERRRAEHETHKVQHILESERVLALDKEEIFKRMQGREAELSEKLADALEDQEKLESQLDSLMAARKKAEGQCETWNMELKQAGEIISSLEGEKQDLVGRVSGLEKRLSGKEDERQHIGTLEKEKQELLRSIGNLERQLSQMDHLESETQNLHQTNTELKRKVSEKEQLEQQNRDLAKRLANFQAQLSETRSLEGEKQELSNRIANLERRLTNENNAKHSAEQMLAQLQFEKNDLSLAIDKMQKNISDKDQLQVENQKLMSSMGEMARLRADNEKLQKNVAEMEHLQRENKNLVDEIDNLQAENKDLLKSSSEIEHLEAENKKLLKNMTDMDQMQSENHDLRERMTGLEKSMAATEDENRRKIERFGADRQEMLKTISDLEAQQQQQQLQQSRSSNISGSNPHLESVVVQEIERLKHRMSLKERKVQLDLELKGYSSAKNDLDFMGGLMTQLESNLGPITQTVETPTRYSRIPVPSPSSSSSTTTAIADNMSHADLRQQLETRNKQNTSLNQDLSNARAEIAALNARLKDHQTTEASHHQALKKVTREMQQERDRAHRIERELEGWRGLRKEKENRRSGSFGGYPPLGDSPDASNRRVSGSFGGGDKPGKRTISGSLNSGSGGSFGGSYGGDFERMSSSRKVSGTKGFL